MQIDKSDLDEELSCYLQKNMEWFFLLKDVRDYLAHFGALHFSLKEQAPAPVTLEIFNKMEVTYFITKVDMGFNALLEYLDTHFTKVIRNA